MSSDDSISTRTTAEPASPVSLAEAIHSSSTEVLNLAASDPALPEDLALGLLKRPELPSETLERLSKNSAVMKSRKVKLALVRHPKTARHVTLPLVRHLFTFDLMQVALMPSVAADIKLAADESLINRLETISTGERLSLAHRASGRIAGALLLDGEPRVMRAALENPRLTESTVVRALLRPQSRAVFVESVCHHPKWSVRTEIRLALLRNDKTPLARALEFVHTLPAAQVREILNGSQLAPNIRSYVMKEIAKREEVHPTEGKHH
jgi:hypothetical protein